MNSDLIIKKDTEDLHEEEQGIHLSKRSKTQMLAKVLGLYDMSGNVWEWCQDWYGDDYYNNSSEKNPKGLETGTDRVVRGGGWGFEARDCRSAARRDLPPGDRFFHFGFRLSRSVALGP